MTTRSEEYCVICQAREIRKEANNWCCDCGEGLCLDCHDIHVNSKLSSNHDIIPIESYKQLPSSLARIVNYCEAHKMKKENYCQYHDKDCCPACIAVDHKSCTDIMLLKDVINAVKTSASLSTTESNVKDLQSNIDHILADRQQNLDTINEERQRYQNEITQNKIKRDTKNLITELLEKTKVANTLAEEIVAIKKYATEYQVYIGSKLIENEVEKEANYLRSLLEEGKLRQNRLKLILNRKLSNIESIIRTFGTVETKIGETSIVLKRRENKQAQIMSIIPNIDKTKISYARQKKKLLAQGITVLPDGKMILADSYYNRLFVINKNGKMEKSISCATIGNGPLESHI
ncbi:unnamed protein product [Mytilus edulis]|uniref:B box-type domain-containing protein n=1 Tax=Mytilus edulis TaxID=6550 RepID=A0A8S3V208_MYTED|nr:unnamed protein product [Mytilus edulis]